MLSFADAPSPLMTLAARKELYELATACQIFDKTQTTAHIREVRRRPNMLLNGMITKLAYPRVITAAPVLELHGHGQSLSRTHHFLRRNTNGCLLEAQLQGVSCRTSQQI